MHAKGYVHRDVKPVSPTTLPSDSAQANFVLSPDMNQVYLTDFGLAAKHLNEQGEPLPAEESCNFKGTISYASLSA